MANVAALYVDSRGSYPALLGADRCWSEERDARTYSGDSPIVAHPPCQRWCRLAGLVEKRWGHKRGEDGGLFAHALATLRRVGGVLEHPAYSDAWKAFNLPKPPTGGRWVPGAQTGEWTCYVEQWRYGHKAKKATWLYYVGANPPHDLRFGHLAAAKCPTAGGPVGLVSWCGNHVAATESRPRLTHREAIHTPPNSKLNCFSWQLAVEAHLDAGS